MRALRYSLLLLGAAVWLGCSDSATAPIPTDPASNLPTSLPTATIQTLQAAVANDLDALRTAVQALPDNVVHSPGNRVAMLARLNALEAEIARGNVQQAVRHLNNLRRWVDGCQSPTDRAQGNDKIGDCPTQLAIRALIDDVIATLFDVLDTTPDVTIDQAATQADPTSDTPIVFTVTFSEPVTGFDDSDVSFTGSTAGGTLAASVSGSGEDYTVSVSGMTTSGIVMASIPAGAAVDADNNPTLASTSTDNSVTWQSPPPSVTIDQAVGQPDPATGGPIEFAVTFSKPVTGFDASDVSFTGSTAGGTLVAVVSGSDADYTVSVSGMTSDGIVMASIPAGAATDAGAQANTASTSTDNSVQYTLGPPTVTVNQAASQADPTSASSISFTVQFSEPVTGFDASDVLFTGSTATGTLVADVSGSGAYYTVTVTGMTGSGTVIVTIAAAAAMDADSNPTAASTSTDNSVTWNIP